MESNYSWYYSLITKAIPVFFRQELFDRPIDQPQTTP
jgi:hypothetical protein